jgi:hypothetical protein
VGKLFDEPADGFVVTMALWSGETLDIAGYVGYLPSDQESIYVVFRGAVNLVNFKVVFNEELVDYRKWPDCNCKVHEGF